MNNSFQRDHSFNTEPQELDNFDNLRPFQPTYKSQPPKRPLSANPSLKLAKSNDFFKKTRIDSCSYVVVKNGIAQAIPFRPRPKQNENIHFNDQTENQ